MDHFVLVSSSRAKKKVWFWPSRYGRFKFQVEDYVRNQKFNHCTVFRPDLLDRGDMQNRREKVMTYVRWTLHARTLSRAMAVHAVKVHHGWSSSGVVNVTDIHKLADCELSTYFTKIPQTQWTRQKQTK